MAQPRQLRNPPITEALVDFRVLLSTPVSRVDLQPAVDAVRVDFPDVQEQAGFQAQFKVEMGRLVPPESRQIFQGVKLTKENGRRQVQFRTDGFTFNNVGSYIGGDALVDEALTLWPRYVAAAHPDRVTRVAMRYINDLSDLPWSIGDPFTRFLQAASEVPKPGPQGISEFLSRVVAHDDPDGSAVIITQQFGGSGDPKHPFRVTIDVDAFLEEDLPIEVGALRGVLAGLRDVKNRAFFSLLTDEAVILYT